MFDITQMWTPDDVKGTHLEDPKVIAAYAGMYTDAGPAFYLEHLKRLRAAGSSPTSRWRTSTSSRSWSG